jgi:hypothetical protein
MTGSAANLFLQMGRGNGGRLRKVYHPLATGINQSLKFTTSACVERLTRSYQLGAYSLNSIVHVVTFTRVPSAAHF